MLDVYLFEHHIGHVTQDSAGISFTYNDFALDHAESYALSVRLPVRKAPYAPHVAAPFFDNLLPEGNARDLLAQAAKYDSSDVQGLLGAIGGECAGAVSLWPKGEAPATTPDYVPCTATDIEQLFTNTDSSAFAEAHLTGRQSMSGVQNKLALLRSGVQYALPRRGSATNVILKRERDRYPGLVQNEIACLRLMHAAGVPAVDATAPTGFAGLFECKRYDRVEVDSVLTRLHQEDFCQATGKLPRQKYQEHGGPDASNIAAVLTRYSKHPAIDIESLGRWMIANVCLGNNDAHAKNLSILYETDGLGLAPVYDVVCTMAYPAIDQRFSLAFGGSYTLAGITPTAFRKCARSLHIPPGRFLQLLDDVTTRLLSNADQICHEVALAYGNTQILGTINSIIKTRSTDLREHLTNHISA